MRNTVLWKLIENEQEQARKMNVGEEVRQQETDLDNKSRSSGGFKRQERNQQNNTIS